MGNLDAWNRLRIGEGIETKALAKGEGPIELQALYQKWLNTIFDIEWPGYYAKHVSIIFIYKDVRYTLDGKEFDDFVVKDGREGPRKREFDRKVDDARLEALFDRVVYPDLLRLGIPTMDIVQTGSFD
jgi:hypothetical protein